MPLKAISDVSSASPTRLPERRRQRHLVSALGTLAAVLVVGVLTTVLVLSRLQSPPGSQTPTTPTALPSGTTWVVPQGLAELDGEPVIAPSNPQMLYRATVSDTQAVPVQLFRSLDGGATWQILSSPTVAGQVGGASFAVSPLSAQTVVLELQLFAGNIQGNLLKPAGDLTPFGASPTISYAHFVSVDGGLHWSVLSLPASGSSQGAAHLFPLGGLGSAAAFLHAQGSRLYAALGVDTNGVLDAHGLSLISSTDGGLTWSQAAQTLIANNVVLCDALPVPGSSEVFAIAQAPSCQGGGALQLWKSTDAGATWNRVSTLSGTGEQGMAIASQGSNASPLLYVLLTSDTPAVSDLMASTDEGKTWVKAPEQGISAGLQLLTGPLGALSDGSVLVAFEAQDTTAQSPFILYRWKAGNAAWQQVGPSFGGSPDYVEVAEGMLWLVTIHGQGVFTVQRLG